MASTLLEFVKKGGTVYYDGSISKVNINKFNIIGSRYSTLSAFKSASIDAFNNLRTEDGELYFKKQLTPKECEALISLQNDIDLNMSIEENFIKILTQDFIRRQRKAITNLTIDGLNANPLLCKALKLNSPAEFLKFYTYSAISRSIVTSMGFFVQDLILYSNTNVYNGNDYPSVNGTKWDVVIERVNGAKSYIEVKSGPNDLDKTQILAYGKAIDLVHENGEQAFLGITYGKKDGQYVSTSILETYVKDWKNKTLIGAEFWDYISDNPNYHNVLMDTIHQTAESFLNEISLVDAIDEKILSLIDDFNHKYGDLDTFYQTLW